MRKVIKNGTTILNGYYVVECNSSIRIIIHDYAGVLWIQMSSNTRKEDFIINGKRYADICSVQIGSVVNGKMEFGCEELIVEIAGHKQ